MDKIPKELLKKIKRIEIKSKVKVNEIICGGYNSIFRGYGMDFQEVREYSPGDDFRRIDWNVTARHNNPYTKRYSEERQLNVMLLIDLSGSLYYGSQNSFKSQKLAETAAILSFTALSNQDKIGAIFFTNKIEKIVQPTKNRNTILRLIREILYLEPINKGTNINNALDYAVKNMKKRGIIFLLSDFYDSIDIKKIYIARKKHDIIPVVFLDYFEEYPINIGIVDMIDNETNEHFLIDTSSKFYKKMILKRKNKRKAFFNEIKKYNIEPLFIYTTDDIEKNLLYYFEKRLKNI